MPLVLLCFIIIIIIIIMDFHSWAMRHLAALYDQNLEN